MKSKKQNVRLVVSAMLVALVLGAVSAQASDSDGNEGNGGGGNGRPAQSEKNDNSGAKKSEAAKERGSDGGASG